jgi:SAM-dependent methyltransferase
MSDKSVVRYYTGEAGQQYHRGKRSIPESAFPWMARLRSEKIFPHITPTDSVFEFGVGYGWNLAQLKCAKKIGCDVSEFLGPLVRKQGIEFISEVESVSDNSFEVAICHHTLEHVLNPAEVLRELNRVIRPNGKLLLFAPFEKERKYRRHNPKEPNHHLFSWNVQTLGNLVEECGFKMVEGSVGRFGYDRFAATLATKSKLGETGFRFIRAGIHLVKPAFEIRIVAVKPGCSS